MVSSLRCALRKRPSSHEGELTGGWFLSRRSPQIYPTDLRAPQKH
jgi:hypothetical protein